MRPNLAKTLKRCGTAFMLLTVMLMSVTTLRAQPPISGIASQMGVVATDLSKVQTGKPVQTKQQKIISELDAVIAALEKECEACRNGMKDPNPSRPLQESVIRSGPGGVGDLIDPQEGGKDWAKLSDRERDRILQSMSEGFPPEYRIVLERYYRRLAEEKTLQPDNAPATTIPAKPTEEQAPEFDE